ncbi:pirin family protein [Psychrobacter sp. CAL346-MNA-CIBAN-0220]|uniref:pirin family protein n=1 Tax=Psychrobacter sp. CAL346-MNA-CIBAN-0220 TaxID=3140457 RepID=UPI0033326736
MRAIKNIHGDKPNHWVGDGFYVQTLINHMTSDSDFNYSHTDPFLLFDYGNPTTFTPNPTYETQPHGIGQHPHKGFETVTIAYAGEISHADSAGGSGVILEGDVQWMTAGRGIIHEEFHSPAFGQRGGLFSMVQMWINLPRQHKLTDPKYQTLKRGEMPTIDLYAQHFDDYAKTNNDEVQIGCATIIAGTWQDKTGTATTFTPINLWDIKLWATGTTMLDIPNSHNVMLLVQEGELLINDRPVNAGKLIQFAAPNTSNTENSLAVNSPVATNATDSIMLTYPAISDSNSGSIVKLLLLSGEPIGQPVAGYGPFVMSTQEELKQTFRDYQNGNFG